MNVSINTSLKGVYIVLDKDGKEIRRSDNIITDHGMTRLVGDSVLGNQSTAPWNRAFVNNLANLFIGSDDTPPSRTDWQLNSAITTGFTVENDPGATGTFTTVDPSTDILTIKFVKQNKYSFSTSATIKEIGCNWTTSNANNATGGIFSRALIPTLNVNDGDTVFIKYVLIIQTDCHRLLDSMSFTTGTGGVPLPENRTNIRYFPFYRLLNTGLPEQTLNNGLGVSEAVHNSRLNELIPPLFEDFGLLNQRYVGSGNTATSSTIYSTAPTNLSFNREWKLHIYNSSSFPSYGNITSTTLNNYNNSSPITTQVTLNSVLKRININNNILNKDPVNGIWQRKLRFIFTPGEWNALDADKMILYPVSPGGKSASGGNLRFYTNNSVDAGILTVFQTPYTPYINEPDPSNPNIFVGFDYTFNFIRL